jgi:hypothetical protein
MPHRRPRHAVDRRPEYVIRWPEVSDQECVGGGLRVVQQREAFHAQLMEARLRELGGVPRWTVPNDVRKNKLAFYASTELKVEHDSVGEGDLRPIAAYRSRK